MSVKPQWVISILTFGTSTINTGVTYYSPFSSNFLFALALVAIFYHKFIPITTMARSSPMMAL
jgi:hypothetical protein